MLVYQRVQSKPCKQANMFFAQHLQYICMLSLTDNTHIPCNPCRLSVQLYCTVHSPLMAPQHNPISPYTVHHLQNIHFGLNVPIQKSIPFTHLTKVTKVHFFPDHCCTKLGTTSKRFTAPCTCKLKRFPEIQKAASGGKNNGLFCGFLRRNLSTTGSSL